MHTTTMQIFITIGSVVYERIEDKHTNKHTCMLFAQMEFFFGIFFFKPNICLKFQNSIIFAYSARTNFEKKNKKICCHKPKFKMTANHTIHFWIDLFCCCKSNTFDTFSVLNLNPNEKKNTFSENVSYLKIKMKKVRFGKIQLVYAYLKIVRFTSNWFWLYIFFSQKFKMAFFYRHLF
jgi:hypothetical protein